MTNPDLTLIGILVDRSGSMNTCRADMEGGIASLLEEQAETDNSIEVTLAQFDTTYDIVYPPTAIKDVPKYVLQPRGGTALLDAMGRFITETGEALAKKKDKNRPGKVLIVIVTDGYENRSNEWTRPAVKALITQQRGIYNWDFVFLGANMDAVSEADSFGIARGSALTFNSQYMPPGIFTSSAAGPSVLGSYVDSYVTTGRAAFSAEDREDAVTPSKP